MSAVGKVTAKAAGAKAAAKGKIYIGTSGWSYKGWAKAFYPEGLGAPEHLAYYAEHFPTVEINATFYRLPEPSTIEKWREKAPSGFLFAIKGSRAVTHYARLKPESRSFPLLLERIEALGPHLGPVLWQLPGSFHKDADRLAAFLETLPERFCHAMEFRHPSWLDHEIYGLLEKHNVALVSLSSNAMPMDLTLTASFTYIRFHGLEGGPAHDYTEEELQPWAAHLRACARKGVSAYVYFNNDVNTRAPGNALLLSKMGGGVKPQPPENGRDSKSS